MEKKKENVGGSNSILQLTVKLGTDNEGKKRMKSEEGIDSTENGGVRRELVITKSLDCPEGKEILPGKTIDGESLFLINITNKEMTVKAAGVLGYIVESQVETRNKGRQNFVNLVLATQKIDVSNVPVESSWKLFLNLTDFRESGMRGSPAVPWTVLILGVPHSEHGAQGPKWIRSELFGNFYLEQETPAFSRRVLAHIIETIYLPLGYSKSNVVIKMAAPSLISLYGMSNITTKKLHQTEQRKSKVVAHLAEKLSTKKIPS